MLALGEERDVAPAALGDLALGEEQDSARVASVATNEVEADSADRVLPDQAGAGREKAVSGIVVRARLAVWAVTSSRLRTAASSIVFSACRRTAGSTALGPREWDAATWVSAVISASVAVE